MRPENTREWIYETSKRTDIIGLLVMSGVEAISIYVATYAWMGGYDLKNKFLCETATLNGILQFNPFCKN